MLRRAGPLAGWGGEVMARRRAERVSIKSALPSGHLPTGALLAAYSGVTILSFAPMCDLTRSNSVYGEGHVDVLSCCFWVLAQTEDGVYLSRHTKVWRSLPRLLPPLFPSAGSRGTLHKHSRLLSRAFYTHANFSRLPPLSTVYSKHFNDWGMV